MSDMKSLRVYSNGRWVQTSSPVVGSGSGITEHNKELPQLAPGMTPLDVLAAWSEYESGVHLFTGGPGSPRNLVLLSKTSSTGTTNTPGGEKPTASESLVATVFLDGVGTTYVKVVTTAIDGVQSLANSEIVGQLGGQWMKMASTKGDEPFGVPAMADVFSIPAAPDLSNYYTKAEVDTQVSDAVAAIPSPDLSDYATQEQVTEAISNIPKGEDRPKVYEDAVEPVGVFADGDLWLGPETVQVAGKSLDQVDLKSPEYAAFRQGILDEVRTMMSGGKAVPADIDWTPCTKVLGSGLIEARVLNGMIQLRGELVYTMTATGSFSTVQRLPANFPKPPQEHVVVGYGKEDGVAYRRIFIRFGSDGSIGVCGDGKITHETFTGAQAYAY